MQRLGNLIFGGGNQTLGKGKSTLVYKTFLPFGGQGEFGKGNSTLVYKTFLPFRGQRELGIGNKVLGREN